MRAYGAEPIEVTKEHGMEGTRDLAFANARRRQRALYSTSLVILIMLKPII